MAVQNQNTCLCPSNNGYVRTFLHTLQNSYFKLCMYMLLLVALGLCKLTQLAIIIHPILSPLHFEGVLNTKEMASGSPSTSEGPSTSRHTKSVWARVNQAGRNPLVYDVSEDAFVSNLIKNAIVESKLSVPVDKVHPFEEAGSPVSVTMTVKDLLESGCGSAQNPLLLNVQEEEQEGMLSQYSS